MTNTRRWIVALLGLAALGAPPALADGCTAVKAAMLAAAQKPHTSIIAGERNGKLVTSRMIQTQDHRYIERDAKWYSMPFTASEFAEMKARLEASKVSCTRIGSEAVDGSSATVYTVHVVNENDTSDHRIWIGADGLPLKTETKAGGGRYTSVLDFAHAAAPADAVPMPSVRR